MALPGDWQPLWQRRELLEQEHRTEGVAPEDEAVEPRRKRRLPWMTTLFVVIVAAALLRSLFSLFGGTSVAAPFSLDLCVSTTAGLPLAADLARGFLRHVGGQQIRVETVATGLRVTAQLPGSLSPTVIDLAASDSTQAFLSLADGDCRVALVTRDVNPLEASRFHAPPAANLVGLDGAVVIVHPSSPLRRITLEQLQRLFAGTTTSWSSIDHQRLPVRVFLPPTHADELSMLIDKALDGRLPTASVQRVATPADAVSAPKMYGALGLTTFHASDPARMLGIVDWRGHLFSPSALSIARKTYPLTMPLYAYHDESSMTNAAYQFLSFLTSNDGQSLIVKNGYISPFPF